VVSPTTEGDYDSGFGERCDALVYFSGVGRIMFPGAADPINLTSDCPFRIYDIRMAAG
jgi:hypothetical protein